MDERLRRIEDALIALNVKLDAYHAEAATNKADIAWLKRGMFGTIFSWIGAVVYSKYGG